MVKKSGIYKITIKNRVYVGSANNIQARWYTHKSTLRLKKHKNRILQNYFNKYGLDLFNFEIIELCAKDTLLEREQHWINTLNPTLNCSKIAGKPPEKTKKQKEIQAQLLRDLLSKKIYQYDLNGNFLNEWVNIKNAADHHKIHKTGISKCANGKFRSFGGFIWLHDKSDFVAPYVDTSLISVALYDTDGNIHKTFNSIKSCGEYLNLKGSVINNAIREKSLISKQYYAIHLDKVFNLSDYKKENLIVLYTIDKTFYGEFTRNELITKFCMNRIAIMRFLNSKKDKPYKKFYLRYPNDEI